MNKITKNSIIAVSIISVVYIFNFVRPDMIVFSLAAAIVMVAVSAKYLFDMKFSRESFFVNSKFLIMPLLFNISALSYISFVYIGIGRLLLTLLGIVSNYFFYVSLKKVRNLGDRAAISYRNVLVVISFFTVFMSTSMLFRLLMSVSDRNTISFVRVGLIIAVFGLVYFVTYFLTWEKGALQSKDRAYGIVSAFLCSQVAWISSMWSINYPVIGISEKATLGGTPIAAIIISITFYFLWGIISHKLDGNLSRKVLTEYLIFTIIFLTILLITAKWSPIS
jgi:hypothetical protein